MTESLAKAHLSEQRHCIFAGARGDDDFNPGCFSRAQNRYCGRHLILLGTGRRRHKGAVDIDCNQLDVTPLFCTPPTRPTAMHRIANPQISLIYVFALPAWNAPIAIPIYFHKPHKPFALTAGWSDIL